MPAAGYFGEILLLLAPEAAQSGGRSCGSSAGTDGIHSCLGGYAADSDRGVELKLPAGVDMDAVAALLWPPGKPNEGTVLVRRRICATVQASFQWAVPMDVVGNRTEIAGPTKR